MSPSLTKQSSYFLFVSNFLWSVFLSQLLTSLTSLHHHFNSPACHSAPPLSTCHVCLACPSLQLLSKMNLNTTTHRESQQCINTMAVLAQFSSFFPLQITNKNSRVVYKYLEPECTKLGFIQGTNLSSHSLLNCESTCRSNNTMSHHNNFPTECTSDIPKSEGTDSCEILPQHWEGTQQWGKLQSNNTGNVSCIFSTPDALVTQLS